MSMWIGSNKADIEITCVNPKKSFSWSFVKQNNPEKKWNQYFHISKKSFLIVYVLLWHFVTFCRETSNVFMVVGWEH